LRYSSVQSVQLSRRDTGRGRRGPLPFRLCLSSTAVLPDICRAIPLSHSVSSFLQTHLSISQSR
jgi:hypothetical protein